MFIQLNTQNIIIGVSELETAECDFYMEGITSLDLGSKFENGLVTKVTRYIDDRVNAYPGIPDQLDYIYHNGIEAWKVDMIAPIKAKYPKD